MTFIKTESRDPTLNFRQIFKTIFDTLFLLIIFLFSNCAYYNYAAKSNSNNKNDLYLFESKEPIVENDSIKVFVKIEHLKKLYHEKKWITTAEISVIPGLNQLVEFKLLKLEIESKVNSKNLLIEKESGSRSFLSGTSELNYYHIQYYSNGPSKDMVKQQVLIKFKINEAPYIFKREYILEKKYSHSDWDVMMSI